MLYKQFHKNKIIQFSFFNFVFKLSFFFLLINQFFVFYISFLNNFDFSFLILDTYSFSVREKLDGVLMIFAANTRHFHSTEWHSQISYQPTITPYSSSLHGKINSKNISLSFLYQAGNYMFKVNNRNTRKRCEICSKLTIKIVVSLLLTSNIFHTLL